MTTGFPAGEELCDSSATELARRLAAGEVSAAEVVTAHLARIERVNPALNAVVTLVPEQALEAARSADRALARGEALGVLHGLPIAVKDLVETRGIRTTYGSPSFRDHVPGFDALLVERLKRAGAIVVGKTNTPEFGAGSQTFNPVFGATRNPYDPTRTAGGSSGGAAAAVAAAMLPLADGSDTGGSLRNPAGFCNVLGLRPTPGRVPEWPAGDAWDPLTVSGPIARTVADAALLLRALAGADERWPLSLAHREETLDGPLDADLGGLRVAWSTDLGGLPVDPSVTRALEDQREALGRVGCVVEEAEPDLAGADEVFHVLRALAFVRGLGGELEARRDRLKETIVWNIEAGLALTPERIAKAQADRTAIFQRTREFFRRYDALALPTAQVPPFPVEVEWVTEIDGVRMESYVDWMRSCSRISVTAHPAVSVPCGFTPAGLPVGLQLVGRYGGELGLLRLAHAFEQATGASRRRPPV